MPLNPVFCEKSGFFIPVSYHVDSDYIINAKYHLKTGESIKLVVASHTRIQIGNPIIILIVGMC